MVKLKMVKLNKQFDAQLFLQKHWQIAPLVLPQAIEYDCHTVSTEILAGLACDADIESRVVSTTESGNEYFCEFGHFDEDYFSKLPDKNWTLLVQAVDEYIKEIDELKHAFDFLPQWRLDDVMLSYATKGGGVGPHFDYYDVFLIQLSGSREWKLGHTCDSNTQLREHNDLKLLEEFFETESHVLNKGDMIYIPAGLAHWGTSLSNDCITASIGFRAPSHSELLVDAISELAEEMTEDLRYKDSFSKPEIDPYLLDETIDQQMKTIFESLDKGKIVEKLNAAFSRQVTSVRHEEQFEFSDFSVEETKSLVKSESITKHPNARFAYRKASDSATLFVNGESYKTDKESASAICHGKFVGDLKIDIELVTELLNNGFLVIEDD